MVSILGFSAAMAADDAWMTDFEAAKAKAEKENKTLLIDFTGSDWCGWCIKLKEEVFQYDAFKDGVKDDFVLVELDYPRDKSGMSKETIAQNEKLKEQYSIRGYPTILLTDAKGNPFARTGYQKDGPEKYVTHLGELMEIKEARDKAFENAADLEGVKKAEALVEGLKKMPLDNSLISGFYGDKIEEIKKADPEDKTGYVKGIEQTAKFAEFQKSLSPLARAKDHQGALDLVENTLDSGDFDGEMKQQVTMMKGFILAELGKFDESLATIDEAKAIAPESRAAKQTDAIKQRITQMQESKKTD